MYEPVNHVEIWRNHNFHKSPAAKGSCECDSCSRITPSVIYWLRVVHELHLKHKTRECLFCYVPLEHESIGSYELRCPRCYMRFYDNPEPKWGKPKEHDMLFFQWNAALEIWNVVDRDTHIRGSALLKSIIATILNRCDY